MVELLLSLIIQFTGITRDVDPELTLIAQQRAIEVQTDWSHSQIRPGTWEVLAKNYGFTTWEESIYRFVISWQQSAPHRAILTDPALTKIGCAVAQAPDGWRYGVCVLTAGGGTTAPEPSPPPAQPPTTPAPGAPPIPMLPDTAMRYDVHEWPAYNRSRWRGSSYTYL